MGETHINSKRQPTWQEILSILEPQWFRSSPPEADAEAIRRIDMAFEDKNQWWLDLGDLPILSIPKQIEKLRDQLQVLVLGKQELRFVEGEGKLFEAPGRPGTLSDIVSLASLRELTTLNLEGCKWVSDLGPLASLTQLTTLSLKDCKWVSDLGPLEFLTQLISLNVGGCGGVSDLKPLRRFSQLTTLTVEDCSGVTDLRPLEALTQLTELNLAGCQDVSDLGPLGRLKDLHTLYLSLSAQASNLDALTSLDRLRFLELSSCKFLSDAGPLEQLSQLTTLRLMYCNDVLVEKLMRLTQLTSLALLGWQAKDLRPVASLDRLESLGLRNCKQVSDLAPLTSLIRLTNLDLGGCSQVKDLGPLGRLVRLAKLNLFDCEQVSDLVPLGSLGRLTSLNLSLCPQVTDLRPLEPLTQLTDLRLRNCQQVSDLTPLTSLGRLTDLDLGGCSQVKDLGPLARLGRLTALRLDNSGATSFGQLHNCLPELKWLSLFGTRFQDIHPSVYSGQFRDNCLDSVRQYFAALEWGVRPDAEIKIFVIGNGGAGKTHLVRRLKGQSFDEICRAAPRSTHGIQIETVPAPDSWNLPHPVQLSYWDFGGQDIYHGTHALFFAEPAIYCLLFSKETENDLIAMEGGLEIQNRRLPYWLEYLKQEAGSAGVVRCPVLIIHSRFDESGRWAGPTLPTAIDQFPQMTQAIPTSSKSPNGLAFVWPALEEAVRRLLQDCPQPPLPTSWTIVRNAIREMQDSKTKPTLSQTEFEALCQMSGCGSNTAVLLDVLHQMGVVFYRKGIFRDTIIVDQGWMLDKVYTIFDRSAGQFHANVMDKHGRFRRKDLELYFWPTEPRVDQRTYLSFMEQCGICFRADQRHRDAAEYEGLYIAPDLLPAWENGHAAQFSWWPEKPEAGVTVTYSLLHDGIARGFLSKIGAVAGDRADYWRYGCHFRDATTKSEVLVRARGNAIRIEARDGDVSKLLQTLLHLLKGVQTGKELQIVWDDRSHTPTSWAEGTDTRSGDELNPELRRPNLERLGRRVDKKVDQLITFYLVGCAFRSGIHGFRDIAKAFGDRGDRLPGGVAESPNGIKGVLMTLAKQIFTAHFGRDPKNPVPLYEIANGKPGSPAVFTEDGVKAWEDTRSYLERRGLLPEWWLSSTT